MTTRMQEPEMAETRHETLNLDMHEMEEDSIHVTLARSVHKGTNLAKTKESVFHLKVRLITYQLYQK